MLEQRDLSEPAVAVFFGESGPTPEGTERMRFPSTEAAVRFVVETLAVKQQVNASLVFDDGGYCNVEGIVALYKRMRREAHPEPAAADRS